VETLSLQWIACLRQRRDQLLLVIALVTGALTGATAVAFILLTERLGMRLYPVGSEVWRRVLIPVLDSLGVGYLLSRHFPEARGSGVPQTKAGLFAHDGVITARTAFGNSFALPLRSQAGSRWDARSLLSRSEVELLRCWAVAWDGAPMDKSHSSPQRSER
jgi:hypothetical protein